jgi:hypothetical protein
MTGAWNGTVPSFAAGQPLPADDQQELADILTALTTDPVDYSGTFTVTATSGGFVKGSSAYGAEYKRLGKLALVTFRVDINTGGGFAAGSGSWRFLLPVTASAASVLRATGAAWINDSGTAVLTAVCRLVTTTHAEIYVAGVTGAALGAAGPGTAWGTNDSLQASILVHTA